MAKGQKRSNREVRKPKQAKALLKADSPFGNKVKLAPKANGPRGGSQT